MDALAVAEAIFDAERTICPFCAARPVWRSLAEYEEHRIGCAAIHAGLQTERSLARQAERRAK